MRRDAIPSDWPAPGWPAPAAGAGRAVGAAMTTRRGGTSAAPWHGFNLGDAVGDDPAAVAAQRAAFAAAIGAAPVWLRQVHGTRRLHVGPADAQAAAAGAPPPEADASLATEPGVACTVLVADCLPLLYADRRGRAVAAAHAGWRGLAAGIAEATLRAVCEAASCEPAEVRVWLGACIGAAALRGRRRRAACLRPRSAGGGRGRAPFRRPRRTAFAASGSPTCRGSRATALRRPAHAT